MGKPTAAHIRGVFEDFVVDATGERAVGVATHRPFTSHHFVPHKPLLKSNDNTSAHTQWQRFQSHMVDDTKASRRHRIHGHFQVIQQFIGHISNHGERFGIFISLWGKIADAYLLMGAKVNDDI